MHLCIHIFRGILRCAEAQSIQAEGVFIAAVAVVGVIFSAGIKLAENKLPIKLRFIFIIIHRNTAAKILHFNGAVYITSYHNPIAKPLARLVNGVGEDFKNRVLAALQPVGAEDDAGPLADPVRPLQTGDTVVVIGFLLGHICLLPG